MTRGKFEPDTATLNFTASAAITALMRRLLDSPDDVFLMEKINEVFTILYPLSLKYKTLGMPELLFPYRPEKSGGYAGARRLRGCTGTEMDPAV